MLAAGFALTVLLVELVFVFKGREYGEDQVRPLYARHLAERSRLQAEVSAAREAQVRLLPQKLPQVPGLSLAAACLPAHVVGGDFYDFFPLDDHRLGIFVAEGGDQGLGSALTIAFAKGFLMPRIAANHTPTEIICDLQERLILLLGTSQDISLAYAVIDASARNLRYARVGSYPQFRVSRDREMTASGTGRKLERRFDLRPEERDVSTEDAAAAAPRENAAPDGSNKCAVREATVRLADGDVIIIVTDGIVKNLKSDKQQHVEEWAVDLLSPRKRAARATLQEALDQALRKRSKRSKKLGVEDDLTAVVLRLEPIVVARSGGGAAL
ncbi:MAG: SpoIIE family protein phosphatase [Pyrinomonadaceae bacterium]